jgi:hypothetical protein
MSVTFCKARQSSKDKHRRMLLSGRPSARDGTALCVCVCVCVCGEIDFEANLDRCLMSVQLGRAGLTINETDSAYVN